MALVLARRCIAIGWMGTRGPSKTLWVRDVLEWASAEKIHIKLSRRDEKVGEDLEVWTETMGEFVEAGDPGERGLRECKI